MKKYITIDGGTTNTRVSLVCNGNLITTKKINRGARAGIDDRDGLKSELRIAILSILDENLLKEKDIERILASGMITSEFGLCEISHLSTPTGIEELHNNMVERSFPEISSIPFVFIRGVKANSTSLSEFDMMRGEETELMGLIALYGRKDESIYVLPGSHSKIIRTDRYGRITDLATMLTGEMIMSLSQGTILKDAIDLGTTEFDISYLVNGYNFAKSEGLNKTLFKVRIMKNIYKNTPKEVYSFFLGAVLCDEIDNILSTNTQDILIGGNHNIKTATAALLSSISNKHITVISDENVEKSTAVGAISVYEYQS